jgi:hypothetical protein
MSAVFPDGTFDRIAVVRHQAESKRAFVRVAVERELRRRGSTADGTR